MIARSASVRSRPAAAGSTEPPPAVRFNAGDDARIIGGRFGFGERAGDLPATIARHVGYGSESP